MSARSPASAAAPVGQSPASLRWRRFLRHRAAVASGILLAVLVLAALLAPWIAQWRGTPPDTIDLLNRLAAPSWRHPLGTDELGRDLLIRLLHGGRISLAVGLTAAVAAACVGTVIGVAAGYRGGVVDGVLMRMTDFVIALPLLPLLIVLMAIDLGKLPLPQAWSGGDASGLWRIVAIIALVGWTTVARLVRGATLAVRRNEYMRAARALGAGPLRTVVRHVLPNVASPIVVATTLSVGQVILLESALSFLGLGIQPPVASWGNMLTNAQELVWSSPQLAVIPGLAIFATVIACNFLGDGLQDALDPRALQERR